MYQSRRDIDAIFEPKAVVYEAARAVADRLHLPDNWLNDAAKSYAPGDDPAQRVVFKSPHLQVAVASPQYLLAMKLLAARVDQDADDIRTLYRVCRFTTPAEGLDLLERFYPGWPKEPRTQLLLEEMFGAPGHRRADRPAAGHGEC